MIRKICPRCGRNYAEEVNFCIEDGAPLNVTEIPDERRCPNCGTEYSAESTYCNVCGKQLTAPPPPPSPHPPRDINQVTQFGVGEVVSDAAKVFHANFWIVFACFIIIIILAMIIGSIPYASYIATIFIFNPVSAGFLVMTLCAIQGNKPSPAQLFHFFDQGRLFAKEYWRVVGAFVVRTLAVYISCGPALAAAAMIGCKYIGEAHAKNQDWVRGFIKGFNNSSGMDLMDTRLFTWAENFQYSTLFILLLLGCVIGIYVCAMVAYLPLVVVDRNVGVGEALSVSSNIGRKYFWRLTGLWALLIPIACAGFIACCIGILYTIPLCMVATTMFYVKVAGITTEFRTE
jgi:hypothetical protein